VSRDRDRDPSNLKPRKAKDRYLRRRAADSTEESMEGWFYRLKLFAEWCESEGIETVGELQPYDMDRYYEKRSAEISPVTLEGEMWTLKMFCRFLEDLGAAEPGLAAAVHIPDLDPEDRSSDVKLHGDRATAMLAHFREDDALYGSRRHAFLELAWTTGARQGGLRALDLQDFYIGDRFVEFRHRPDTGTPLKNKRGGERPVALKQESVDAIAHYIRHERVDATDDHSRQPLLTTIQGRPSSSAVRTWSYLATLPCLRTDCPHGKSHATCEWTHYTQCSKCPSSRSPHPTRTGAVTYMLNQGWPPEDVAERVNATVKTIEQHYDKADPERRRQRLRERMEDRRRDLIENTDFTSNAI
jgi:site-specific recombinase XerD